MYYFVANRWWAFDTGRTLRQPKNHNGGHSTGCGDTPRVDACLPTCLPVQVFCGVALAVGCVVSLMSYGYFYFCFKPLQPGPRLLACTARKPPLVCGLCVI